MTTRLVMLLGTLPLLGACGTTVQPGQMAMKNLILHEPALQKEILPEGFYWQWAWNELVT